MKTKPVSIFQACQDNWPEDEAFSLVESWKDYREDYGPDWEPKVRADIAHMEKVFHEGSDGPDLVARYRAVITKELGIAF